MNLFSLQRMLVAVVGMCLLALAGCEKLGVAVSPLLPAKRAKPTTMAKADTTGNDTDSAPDEGGDPSENMGGGFAAGGDEFGEDAGYGDGTDDTQMNFGEGADLDPSEEAELGDDLTGEGAMSAPELEDGDPDDPAGSLFADYGKGELADPGVGPVEGAPSSGSAEYFGNAGGGATGRSRGRPQPGGKKARRPANPNAKPARVKPVFRLTANSVLPVMTEQGQRVGFSVEYQLQKGELNPRAQYGLVVEAAKAGRFGVPARLRDEGTIPVPAVPSFRTDSGPFKGYLIEITSRGPQRISNEVKFNPRF